MDMEFVPLLVDLLYSLEAVHLKVPKSKRREARSGEEVRVFTYR